MKQFLQAILIFILLGCNNTVEEKTQTDKQEWSVIEEKPNFKPLNITYERSFYKMINDTIYFARTVKDSNDVRLIKGKVTFDKNYNTEQSITENRIIEIDEAGNLENKFLNSGYRKKIDDYPNVIFVQLRPENFKELELLDLRQSIENKIEKALLNEKLGNWIASDIGPGGANILFEVSDWDKSFKRITELLNSESLLDQSLITKRLYISRDDWNYEVVYPFDFEGDFIQM